MEPHEARIADKVHARFLQRVRDYSVEFLPAWEPLVADDARCDARFFSADEPEGIGLVGQDKHDLRRDNRVAR